MHLFSETHFLVLLTLCSSQKVTTYNDPTEVKYSYEHICQEITIVYQYAYQQKINI